MLELERRRPIGRRIAQKSGAFPRQGRQLRIADYLTDHGGVAARRMDAGPVFLFQEQNIPGAAAGELVGGGRAGESRALPDAPECESFHEPK